MIGRTFGQYEILERIGAGGMGAVYRARDTKLNRMVAVKVLPELFAADAERLARFEREARLSASLNHPNIATLFDFIHADGVHFLVMELIEGDSLSDRLARGPLPMSDAVALAMQIADALETAHDHGIVHRDLKPSNVKLTADGSVKVLDFGLAKAVEGDAADQDLSHSPTITAGGTAAGMILGTAAYMSPEQARGRVVDKRTDIWAFGCMLYEMLTGRQIFAGETVSDTIAKILERAPDWDSLPGNVSPRVRRLLERCLEKDPKRRLRDIGEARVALEDALADSRPVRPAGEPARRGPHPLLWAVAGLVVGAVAVFFWARPADNSGTGRDAVRLSLKPQGDAVPVSQAAPSLSHDGRMLSYAAYAGDKTRIFLRDLSTFEDRMLVDVDGTTPIFSHDDRWIVFTSRDQSGIRIMRISVDGGTPLPICPLQGGPNTGATTADGYLVAEMSLTGGLSIVPLAGGTPKRLTRPDSTDGELGHWSPCVLPDDDHVLFTAWRSRMADSRIKVVSRKTGETKVVVESGVSPLFLPPRYLLYTLGATLMCAPFDPDRVEVTGDPVPVVDPVMVRITDGVTTIAVSPTGTLCYLPPSGYDARLVWGDLSGHVEPVVPERRDYDEIAISRDGTRIAADIEANGKSDIWVLDLERHAMTQLTVDGTNGTPIWTPDGRQVTFESMRRGPFELYSINADGSSPEQLLFPSPSDLSPNCWTPDGGTLVYGGYSADTNADIMRFSTSDGKQSPLVRTAFSESSADISRDGDWVAYVVGPRASGDVYVSPMAGGARVQVSVDGGASPRWSPDGRWLYYINATRDGVNRAGITTSPSLRAGKPEQVLDAQQMGGFIESYDVHPDGRRVAMVINDDDRGKHLYRIVLNWDTELARLVAR